MYFPWAKVRCILKERKLKKCWKHANSTHNFSYANIEIIMLSCSSIIVLEQLEFKNIFKVSRNIIMIGCLWLDNILGCILKKISLKNYPSLTLEVNIDKSRYKDESRHKESTSNHTEESVTIFAYYLKWNALLMPSTLILLFDNWNVSLAMILWTDYYLLMWLRLDC